MFKIPTRAFSRQKEKYSPPLPGALTRDTQHVNLAQRRKADADDVFNRTHSPNSACQAIPPRIKLHKATIMSQPKPAPLEGEDGSPNGLIFVVDDNELLVEFAATVLESDGYRVKSFFHPEDVLKAIEAGEEKPALLVTDYDMTEMDGLALIVSCHQIHPALKTILLSGTIDGSMASPHPARVHRFLGKPYQPAQLKTLVAELLRSRPGRGR